MTSESLLETDKYVRWLTRLFGTEYTKKFDCDDFALVWKGLTNLRHAKARGGETESIAAGVVWYNKNGTSPHAAIVTKTEGGWHGLEPQTNTFFNFDETERKSAWFVLF